LRIEPRAYKQRTQDQPFQSSDYSSAHAEAFARRYDEGRRVIKTALVRRYLANCVNKEVLDIGCGVGFFSSLSQDLRANPIACDFSEAMVQKVRQRYGRSFPILRASAEAPPVRNGCIDTVLVLDLIEHLYDPERMLINSARVLRPGGSLIITTDVKGFVVGRLHLYTRRLARRLLRTVITYLSRSSRGHNMPMLRQISASVERRWLSNPYTTPLCTHTYEYRVPELIQMVKGAGFIPVDFETFPNRAAYGMGGRVLELILRGRLKRYKWPHAIYKFSKPQQ
jgi:SAM-dependent methyltransferase